MQSNPNGNANLFELTIVRDGMTVNVVDGLFAVADAIQQLAHETRMLGNGTAVTENGAIEGLAMQLKESSDRISAAIDRSSDEGF